MHGFDTLGNGGGICRLAGSLSEIYPHPYADSNVRNFKGLRLTEVIKVKKS
jgi:hypothetical protein